MIKDSNNPVRGSILVNLNYAFDMNDERREDYEVPDYGTSALPEIGDDGDVKDTLVVCSVIPPISHRKLKVRETNKANFDNNILKLRGA